MARLHDKLSPADFDDVVLPSLFRWGFPDVHESTVNNVNSGSVPSPHPKENQKHQTTLSKLLSQHVSCLHLF